MKTVTTLDTLQYNELHKAIKDALEESIYYADQDSKGFYEDISFDDYFNSLIQEIWSEEDELLGEGIKLVSFSVIITDENKEEIEECFNSARDEAWEEYIEEAISL